MNHAAVQHDGRSWPASRPRDHVILQPVEILLTGADDEAPVFVEY